MDARRVLPFLLLIIYIINGAFANQNAWSRQYNVRRIRRINEYLVPPPPPKSYPGRIPRLANYQPTPQPGYFQQLMNFLNPFSSDSSPQLPPPPPPLLPPQPEVAKFGQSYNAPPLVDYEKPPLPPTSFNHLPNDYSGYPAPVQIKNCSACNRIPWMPIQDTQQGHDGSASYASPSLESSGDRYLPTNHEIPHDAYHAASQEVRAPDFSFAPPLPNIEQNSPFVNPLSNPHLFPGAMPPLFKAVNFKQPVQAIPHENSGHLNSPPLSISNSASTIAGPTFNDGHNEQYVYPGPLTHSGEGIVSQELGYTNPSISNEKFENVQNVQNQNNVAHDLSSSGTQVSQGHTSGVSNNEELYEVTGLSGSDVSQINQNFPSSYGISSLDRFPNNYEHSYNDLSSSANVAEGSSTPLHIDESSGNVGDSINFEESPLLDFTQKDESRTHSSSIPTNSNAFADFQSTKITGTTVALGDEIFGTRQGIASTESYPSTDYIEIIDTVAKESKINNSIIQGTNGKPFRNLLNNDVAEETLSDNINLDETSGQQGATRNRQIQLIIPYTSQYTPLPFHSSHERNTDISESNHDSYIGEESRNRIEVISPPNSSHIFQNFVPKIFDNVKKSIDAKMNNSIDVRKLQQNIDNWTIQEYSKATTVRTISPNSSQIISTVSPKSSNPYLFPSKKIPTEYFMTTKPVNYVADSHNDNSNILTLSGFTFSDEDNKGSGSNPVKESRVIQIEKSTGSSIDASTASENLWQGFPVGISSVNRERVYIVTPQPTVTTPRLNLEYRQEKALKEAERNRKELKKTDTKITQKTDTFESIEKAYQVLPQAVNNLAVASTGPESVPLWGIMEHEEFASPVYSEYDNNDTEPPMPHSRFSKESRASR